MIMENQKKCVECDVDFSFLESNKVYLSGLCRTNPAYFCPSCGRLHWSTGKGVSSRYSFWVGFFKEGKVVRRWLKKQLLN